MQYIVALAVSLSYWLLDSYIDVLTFSISLKDAIFLNFPQAHPWLKIFLALLIFFLTIFFTHKNNQNSKVPTLQSKSYELVEVLEKISNIVLSPTSISKQINDIAATLKEMLNLQVVFIGEYKNDSIVFLNTDSNLSSIGFNENFFPHRGDYAPNSLSELISLFYIEKRDFIDKKIYIDTDNKKLYRTILVPMSLHSMEKQIGLFGIITSTEDEIDYRGFLELIAQRVAFAINFSRKRVEMTKSLENYKSQILPIDPDLKIFNHPKVQEVLEHEQKRSIRYKNELSIIIFEIDYLENLSNIFSIEDIKNLKKELLYLFKKSIRETDCLGKWRDANQYIIVAPNIDFRGAKSFTIKLNKKLQEHRFSKIGKITCSYGITSYAQKDTLSSFISRAQRALEIAKKRGGNSIEVKILV